MSNSYEIHDMDTPEIRVPVTKSDGSVLSLSGATVEAWAKRHGQDAIELTTTITDEAGGIITVSVGADDLDEGVYTLHVRVTKATETQTVVEAYIIVKVSIGGSA